MDVTTEGAPPLVLVVEDDPTIREVLQALLESVGDAVAAAPDGITALARVEAGGVDLVLLDIMLPDVNGLDLCRQFRAYEDTTYLPIIMITALNGEADRHAGFAAGADDYVVKPFENDELMARVRALLRRAQPRQVEVLRFQDIELVPNEREARRGGEPLELTAREYELLELFMRHPRQVLTREQILQEVWGFDFLGDSNLVDVRIKYLRDKLEAAGRTRVIQTVRGAGYALR
jgi:two-component system, OmpR family, response regulator MprA